MSTETMGQKQLDELDQILGWDFSVKPEREYPENAVVPDGWYYMELIRVGKPYSSKGKYGEKTKCAFEFVILAEADKKNQKVESEYEGGKLPAFVNIEARDKEKSTMYPLCSALLGQDAEEWSLENGQVLPSKLIGRKCWVYINTTANEKGDTTSWLNKFAAQLPQVQFSAGNRTQGQTQNRQPSNQPAKAEPPF